MRKTPILLALLLLGGTLTLQAATPPAAAPPPDANAAKARQLLDEMVQALGGQRWLNLQNSFTLGRIAAFYKGKPTEGMVRYWAWTTPTQQRIDLTEKKRDKQNWVQIITPTACWEITYRGKRPLDKKICDSDRRSREHSIAAAVKVWMKDPNTLLMYDGQVMSERHLADQVTLLNDRYDAITIRIDAQTHLPLSRAWSWRDPVYHDQDKEVEEYDDYHNIDGLPTPFTITRFYNGDMTSQRFVTNAGYNVPLPPNGFDLDAIAARATH
jgi:hypothetical protein